MTESPAARPPFSFTVEARDPGSAARAGILHTPHGDVETPTFMAVGTQGTVKTLTSEQVAATGTRIVLANTYHLSMRPGAEAVAELGGLHSFTGWPGPTLTDSGGFQVYSLEGLREVDDDGVTFQSHFDGTKMRLSPEEAVRLQELIGADIIMALDECLPYPVEREAAAASLERTLRWARRCADARTREDQALFAVIQGATYRDLRLRCAGELAELDLPGYAIGGLSVGEGPGLMAEVLSYTAPAMPEDRPRYLMGVGPPEDILTAVEAGVDMFDCVMPTRNARGGGAFMADGKRHLRRSCYRDDPGPVEPGCGCYCCSNFSRGYVRHLLNVGEVTGATLLSIHNLSFYARFMGEVRDAVAAGDLSGYAERFRARYRDSAD